MEQQKNNSFQKKGESILVSIDFVYNLKGEMKGPWHYLIDCACNLLYMNLSGMHTAFDNSDQVENAHRLCSLVKLIQKRHTFVPPMQYDYRAPSQQSEIANIQKIRGCTELQAVDAYRKFRSHYRMLYRMKYLQRIAKLARSGWTITNLDIKFSTNQNEHRNGEVVCAISHEELSDGKLAVQLGNMRELFRPSTWSQSAILLWSSFVQYMFSSLEKRNDQASVDWTVMCPVSKAEVDLTEHRPVGIVLEDALSLLEKQ